MIVRTLAVTMILLVAYEAWLRHAQPYPGLHRVRSQLRRNRVRAEEFVHERSTGRPSLVVVGSSLSTRLDPAAMPVGSWRLAFGGMSAWEGLEILRRLDVTPGTLMIEANTLLNAPSAGFVDDLFREPQHTLRDHLLMFREKYRPSLVLGEKIRWWWYWARDKSHLEAGASTLRRAQIAQVQGRSRDVDPDRVKQVARAASERAEALRKMGSGVIFFVAPVPAEIASTPAHRELLEAIRGAGVELVEAPPEMSFTYSDAMHLDVEGGRKFTEWLMGDRAGTPPATGRSPARAPTRP